MKVLLKSQYIVQGANYDSNYLSKLGNGSEVAQGRIPASRALQSAPLPTTHSNTVKSPRNERGADFATTYQLLAESPPALNP